MAFAQLTYRESLRDIETCLGAVGGKLYHMGFRTSVARSTLADANASVITSKAANGYHFKTGQQKWPSRTEIVLPCRLLWWQVGFGAPALRATLEHVS